MVAAITRRQRGGSLTSAQAGAILGHFRRHAEDRYSVLEVNSSHLIHAMSLSRTHALRAYDAVQLAVALTIDRASRQASLGPVTLVSADRELNVAATAEKLSVDDPMNHI